MLQRRPKPPLLHPSAGEDWFRSLPSAKRRWLHESIRASAAQDERLMRAQCGAILRVAGETAAVFALLDGLCPGRTWGTVAGALAFGAGLGVIFAVKQASRLSSGVVAMLAFLVLQMITRSGLSGNHLFFMFVAGGVCSILGMRREE